MVLRAASVNPVLHYDFDMGLLCEGDEADFIVTDDLTNFIIKQTYINGQLVAENGKSLINSVEEIAINQFDCATITKDDLIITANTYPSFEKKIPVIEALDGQLITNKLWLEPTIENQLLVSDTHKDILKMVVVNRYHSAPIAKCFIQNFGFKQGAIASSVAHDSHNIVAVGVDDESLAKAINLVIQERGGISVVDADSSLVLGLPVAGLMSTNDGYQVAAAYTKIDRMAKNLGSSLEAPFMTLSFMALLVIPHLKLSDKGLFDGDSFSFIPLVQD